jgi:hypothetical protein
VEQEGSSADRSVGGAVRGRSDSIGGGRAGAGIVQLAEGQRGCARPDGVRKRTAYVSHSMVAGIPRRFVANGNGPAETENVTGRAGRTGESLSQTVATATLRFSF